MDQGKFEIFVRDFEEKLNKIGWSIKTSEHYYDIIDNHGKPAPCSIQRPSHKLEIEVGCEGAKIISGMTGRAYIDVGGLEVKFFEDMSSGPFISLMHKETEVVLLNINISNGYSIPGERPKPNFAARFLDYIGF